MFRLPVPQAIAAERRLGLGLRWLLLAVGIWLTYPQQQYQPFNIWSLSWLWLYGFFTLLSTVWYLWLEDGQAWSVYLTFIMDMLFVTALVANSWLSSPLPFFFAVLAIKASYQAEELPLLGWGIFLSGPLYTLGLYGTLGYWFFLWEPPFLVRFILLLLLLIVAIALGRRMASLRRLIRRLEADLITQQEDLAHSTEVLQRTAADLGTRLLQLRSLQDVSQALSSSLHMEDAILIIVRRLADLTGFARAGLLLLNQESGTARLVSIAAKTEPLQDQMWTLSFPDPLLQYLMEHGQTVLRPDSGLSGPLVNWLEDAWGDTPLVLSPLVRRGNLLGVLVLGDPALAGEMNEEKTQLADSFAYFAATAVENARLYENVLEQRQELEAVLQGIGDGVLVVDSRGLATIFNRVAQEIFGSALQLHAPLSIADLDELFRETREAMEVRSQDFTWEMPGGHSKVYQVVAAPVQSHLSPGVVAVLRDVTTQKELERMKSNFLSAVSHELKTPLHSIKGFVEIILMGKTGPLTPTQRDFLTTVRDQTRILQRMIEDLLVFSRLEAGHISLQVEAISLAAVAAGVVQKLEPLGREAQLRLESRLPDDFPDVEADNMRMEQVLTNLVENGIKFTPPGGLVLVNGEDLGDRVRIWVQDTGIGIPHSEQEKIFDRFYQVDASERRAYRGTGLGLTICKHIVLNHHGRIWVKSTPGQGSTFYVELFKKIPATAMDRGVDYTTMPG